MAQRLLVWRPAAPNSQIWHLVLVFMAWPLWGTGPRCLLCCLIFSAYSRMCVLPRVLILTFSTRHSSSCHAAVSWCASVHPKKTHGLATWASSPYPALTCCPALGSVNDTYCSTLTDSRWREPQLLRGHCVRAISVGQELCTRFWWSKPCEQTSRKQCLPINPHWYDLVSV